MHRPAQAQPAVSPISSPPPAFSGGDPRSPPSSSLRYLVLLATLSATISINFRYFPKNLIHT